MVMMAVAFIISSSCCSTKSIRSKCAHTDRDVHRYCLQRHPRSPTLFAKSSVQAPFHPKISQSMETKHSKHSTSTSIDMCIRLAGWCGSLTLTSMAGLAEQRARAQAPRLPIITCSRSVVAVATFHSINSGCNYFSLSFSQHIMSNRKVLLLIFRGCNNFIVAASAYHRVCARASFCLMSDSLMIRCNRLGSMLVGAHWE